MVTHNNESALTIVVPRHAFAEISFERENQFTWYAYIGKFIQTKEETKLFIIAKKENSQFSFKKTYIQVFGYSSDGSLKDDSFVVETFLYNICAGTDHGIKANSTSSLSSSPLSAVSICLHFSFHSPFAG